jgi:hypothetical protein
MGKLAVVLAILLSRLSFGQSTQNIIGIISENFTEKPIEGVNVKLFFNDSLALETLSNSKGEYSFNQVDLGSYDISFAHIKYKAFVQPSVTVSISKETILNVSMESRTIQLTEVEINPEKDRGIPNNEMAHSSVFSIHPRDASRIAGGLDDPIRVAGTLPGVTAATGFSSNFISIRGNSPRGLKYYTNGVELPNPTHFARIGSSGGTFTIFSLGLLDKSDFYTGGFSAEYGDALAGVFDVKFKTGNTNQHEMAFQVGTLGIEFGAEGPLSKKIKSSYAFNYRYATVSLARVSNPSQPTYQDLSFNLTFPFAKSKSKLQIFAISGISDRVRHGVKDSTLWQDTIKDYFRTNLYLNSKTASIGIIYKKFVGQKSVFNATLLGSYTDQGDNKEYILDNYEILNQRINEYSSIPLSAALTFKHKFSLRHQNITGVNFTTTQHTWNAEKYNFITSQQQVLLNGNGRSNLLRAFTQSKYSFNEKLSLYAGLHYMVYDVNHKQVVEPRGSIKYQLNARHGFSFSAGKYSQVENFATYMYQSPTNTNNVILPNKNIDFTKANHYVLGYYGKVFKNHNLRIEIYQQDLYDVVADSGSFSTLNISELQDLRQVGNLGTGLNRGIDIGFERYTDNGLYYIINTSIYRSIYSGGDGVVRSTAFDNMFNLRFIVGKEYKLRESLSKKNITKFRSFAWNSNLSVLGGETFTPLDLTASKLEQETIYDETNAYRDRGETLLFLDFNFSYTVNKNERKTVWGIQVKNIFSNGNAVFREYDITKDKEVIVKSNAFFPNIFYRLEF